MTPGWIVSVTPAGTCSLPVTWIGLFASVHVVSDASVPENDDCAVALTAHTSSRAAATTNVRRARFIVVCQKTRPEEPGPPIVPPHPWCPSFFDGPLARRGNKELSPVGLQV